MKLIKNFIQYDTDGYTAERKFAREANGSISLTASMGLNLIPFAMDVEHTEFIIFMIPRKEEANLYLWVYIGPEMNAHEKELVFQKNRITAVNDLMQYTKWTSEPMDVSGKYSDEIISKAVNVLQGWSDLEIWEALKAFEARLNETGGSNRWKKYDKDIQNGVKEAKKDLHGIMYMY